MKRSAPMIDLYSLGEDQRIEIIGDQARRSSRGVAVLLEKNEPEKIERYIRKMAERHPTVALLRRGDGPTPLIVTLVFGQRPKAPEVM